MMKYRKLKIGTAIIFLGAIVLSVIGLLFQRLTPVDLSGDLILYAGYGLITLDYIFTLTGDFPRNPWYELSTKMPKADINKFKNLFKKRDEGFVRPESWDEETSASDETEVAPNLAVEPVPYFGNLDKRKRFGIPLPVNAKRILAFILLIFSFFTSIPAMISPNSRFALLFTVPFMVLFFDYLSITRYSVVVSAMHILDDVETI